MTSSDEWRHTLEKNNLNLYRNGVRVCYVCDVYESEVDDLVEQLIKYFTDGQEV